MILVPVLAALIAAEIIALNAAGQGTVDSKFGQGFVAGTIAAGLVMIAMVGIMGSGRLTEDISTPVADPTDL